MPDPTKPYGNPHLDWQAVTVDTLLSRAPVLIGGVVVTADGVGATTVSFWDGVNASAYRRFRVNALVNESRPVIFPAPILFQLGLFVDVGANILEVLVLYAPLRDEPPVPSPDGGEG